jgi:hypothetical protein
MKNIKYEVRGDILIINVDLKEHHGPSSSGKSTIIATTAGNHELPSHPGVVFGMNVYLRKREKGS